MWSRITDTCKICWCIRAKPSNAASKSRLWAPRTVVTLPISILKCANSSRPLSVLVIAKTRAVGSTEQDLSSSTDRSEPDWHFLSCRPRWRHLILFLTNDGVIRKRADYQKHLEIPRLRSE